MRKPKFDQILTKEFLQKEHIENKRSAFNIAKQVGCNNKLVVLYINLHGLPRYYYSDHYKKTREHAMWAGHQDLSMTYWNNVKNGAKNRNINFNLSIIEAWNLYEKQNKRCALSGLDIGFEASKSNSASLDRIDSSKGYELSNIQWVHRDINFAKQSLSNKEFIDLCRMVANYN